MHEQKPIILNQMIGFNLCINCKRRNYGKGY
nr:MAG TPA: hypothetical protein [Caudoviricetes sp.]DAN80826.1 MAG TPA: hypothetical protein [Caudoviricetes sp.]